MHFFKRGRNRQTPIKEKKLAEAAYCITISEDQFIDLFTCTAALKIWLPDSVDSHLEEISNLVDASVSDVIRQILFIHLYGHHAFLGCLERSCADFTMAPTKAASKFPYGRSERPDIAKKVYLPQRMKVDLQLLSVKHKQPVSTYCRQVIATHLYGQQAECFEPPSDIGEGFE